MDAGNVKCQQLMAVRVGLPGVPLPVPYLLPGQVGTGMACGAICSIIAKGCRHMDSHLPGPSIL